MRDKRFVANHMGGPLSLEKHRLLINWAVNCVKHGIEIANEKPIDERALKALEIAEQWGKGNATVGEAVGSRSLFIRISAILFSRFRNRIYGFPE